MHLQIINFILWVVIATQSFSAHAQQAITYLSETGLYKNILTKEISSEVHEYLVEYPLWSDGLDKKRWIYIPPSTQINTQDANWWEFPVGTKIWKEFAAIKNGKIHRIETRLMLRLESKWQLVTYLWNSDNSEAKISDGNAYYNYYPLENGVYHNIPANNQCMSCHYDNQSQSRVIGFSALQLAHNKGKLNLLKLKELNLLSHQLPAHISIKSESADGVKAIGLLHGNCAHCHNPRGLLGELNLNLKHDVHNTSSSFENAYVSTINRYSNYTFPDFQVSQLRILPGNPNASVLFRRVKASNHLDPYYMEKMPPGVMGTMSANEELVNSLFNWISNLNHLQKLSLERR